MLGYMQYTDGHRRTHDAIPTLLWLSDSARYGPLVEEGVLLCARGSAQKWSCGGLAPARCEKAALPLIHIPP